MDKLTSGTLTPAYGRDYTSKVDLARDFDAGKDFVYHRLLDEGIVGKADFAEGARLQVRYGRQRKVAVLTVGTPTSRVS